MKIVLLLRNIARKVSLERCDICLLNLVLTGKFILVELIVCAAAVAVSVLLMYGHRQVIKRRQPVPNFVRSYANNLKRQNMPDESVRLLDERPRPETSDTRILNSSPVGLIRYSYSKKPTKTELLESGRPIFRS